MEHYVLLDFGSTFTKVSVADRGQRAIVHTDRFPSSVRTDAGVCLEQCLESARGALGAAAFAKAMKMASSSAAGGLRMAVIGLSRTLSMTAARNAAFGAGAKIIGSFIGELSDSDIRELAGMDAEIILLCGGYENGSVQAVEHNAAMIAASETDAPIIFAGNGAVSGSVRRTLLLGNKTCYLAPNIIPAVGVINTRPAEELIRHIFMKRIINMKGLGTVQAALDAPLVPTPTAVLTAGDLLSRGTARQTGVGALMVIDVGGATTDIHSYAEQMPYEGARLLGSPEPYARRTVEGDMGMRESSISLAKEIGWDRMAANAGVDAATLRGSIARRAATTDFIPDNELEWRIEREIACGAVRVSARRHAGRVRYVHASNCRMVQYGKNITRVRTVIGTGGPLVNSPHPKNILHNVCRHADRERELLLPESAEFFLDRRYILYAGGLLRKYDDDLALSIVKDGAFRI